MIAPYAAQPITFQDIVERAGLEEYRDREIVDGVWVSKERAGAMSIGHGRFGGNLFGWLWSFLRQNPLGEVYLSETIFVLEADDKGVRIMRKPDIAFVSTARLRPPEASCYTQAPDLVVEVVSPSERVGILRGRLRDYFRYGTQQVWRIYPEDQEVMAYTAMDVYQVFRPGDILTGGELLPGFSVAVADLFR